MHILVFGRTGQVARALQDLMAAKPDGALASTLTFLSREEVDLTDPQACSDAIIARAPDAVINAAAYTGVDAAETDTDQAHKVNAEAPSAMARACASQDIPFVTISTDYVFDGSGTAPWSPDDSPQPLGVYGYSKLAGEKAVRAAGGRFAILRTSWVFSAYGQNFVKTMLRLAETRDSLTIVGDQIGGPTAAADIAAACLRLAQCLAADPDRAGLYHFSGTPDVSWADFAREIFRQAGVSCMVTPISSADYPTVAKRPLNSRMECELTAQTFQIERPDWTISLAHVLKQLEQA
ncbi:dTDP-4-dehydrorhamnose reductase [Thalassorhabdomicrobium marinisediminis]|uniref:dTDP-4-dehydrorhamnose reductase n=1 Tax=Thalassorhabdomicrobium marinisediminis TaxID=2170577 RepID=A0A2T7FSQ9_9RHOB|nr:dTDP-4-dehydrorhamnose reductase [Thalassorhabdomicrobium marinisediminis]PVA05204.1 dTDP-4-dehydrorhamnose reductase [Thalassorhabdomicrobium marinisediminis]